jgi:hypothetical protein
MVLDVCGFDRTMDTEMGSDMPTNMVMVVIDTKWVPYPQILPDGRLTLGKSKKSDTREFDNTFRP